MANKILYLELPAGSTERAKGFYGGVFGWTFQDWGPEYATFHEAGLEGGFHAGSEGRPAGPLVVIETEEIEAMEEKVKAAGGVITAGIFAFPGGRRFHFRDLEGNELAVMQAG